MLNRLGGGIGSLALLDLMNRNGALAAGARKEPAGSQGPNIPAKAKAVISSFATAASATWTPSTPSQNYSKGRARR